MKGLSKTTPTDLSDRGEPVALDSPAPVAVRPRDTEPEAPVVPVRDSGIGTDQKDATSIPVKPRVPTRKQPEETEITFDPPDSEAGSEEAEPAAQRGNRKRNGKRRRRRAFAPQPKVSADLEEPPGSPDASHAKPDAPSTAATGDALLLRPRAVENPEIESIKTRAAENAKAELEVPDGISVKLQPRPTKIDPSAEIEVIGNDDDEGGADDEHVKLQDRKTGVTRLMDDTVFAEETQRLEKDEIPRWEREASEEDDADPDGPDAQNMLVPDEEGGGYKWVSLTADEMLSPGARRRRALAKKAVLVVLLIAGLFVTSVFARTAYLAMRSEQKRAEAEAAAARAAEGLSETEVLGADAAIRAWSQAASIDEMLPLVRKRKRVESLMHEHYGNKAPEPIDLGQLKLKKKLVFPAGVFIVLAYGTEDDENGFKIVTAEKSPEGDYLIDWELSVGYQPIPLEEFKRVKPASPTPFRVVAHPDSYYDHTFPAEEFACYKLSYPGTDFSLYGYARRDGNAADILFVQTAGRALSLVLDLRYLDDPLRDDRVEITGVAKLDWFY